MSKSIYTPEFKTKIAQECLDGLGSIRALADKYSVGASNLVEWINKYQIHGISAFISGNGNRKYTKEFKVKCVEAVLSGEGSVNDILVEYNISTRECVKVFL